MLGLVLLGCGGQPEPGAGLPGEPDIRPAAELVPVTFDQWRQELAALRGHIVVVDLWATWCLPCIERFPRMVELSRTYAQHKVRFVGLCLDDRGDPIAVEEARAFLAEQRADFANYLMDEVVTDAFAKLDILSIPAVFVYGPDGNLRHRLTGDDPNDQFTENDVERAIQDLLAEVAA